MTTAYRYKGKLYPRMELDRMSVMDTIHVNTRLAELGLGTGWNELILQVAALPRETAEDMVRIEYDQGAQVLAAIVLWISLRRGGLDLTFDDALDLPLGDVEQIELTEDHKDAAPKARARKGSARAGASTKATHA